MNGVKEEGEQEQRSIIGWGVLRAQLFGFFSPFPRFFDLGRRQKASEDQKRAETSTEKTGGPFEHDENRSTAPPQHQHLSVCPDNLNHLNKHTYRSLLYFQSFSQGQTPQKQASKQPIKHGAFRPPTEQLNVGRGESSHKRVIKTHGHKRAEHKDGSKVGRRIDLALWSCIARPDYFNPCMCSSMPLAPPSFFDAATAYLHTYRHPHVGLCSGKSLV